MYLLRDDAPGSSIPSGKNAFIIDWGRGTEGAFFGLDGAQELSLECVQGCSEREVRLESTRQ